MTDKKLQHCSFCGKHKDEVTKLIVGDDVSICSSCIALCSQLIDEEKVVDLIDKIGSGDFDAYSIKEHLDQLVIGQKSAKEVLAVAISNHYKRITNPPEDLEIQKGIGTRQPSRPLSIL